MADRVSDVFKVHSSALDEDANGNDSVEGFLRACGVGRAGHFGGGRGQEVCGTDALDGGVGLELGGGVEAARWC